jgi:hypothetical protein
MTLPFPARAPGCRCPAFSKGTRASARLLLENALDRRGLARRCPQATFSRGQDFLSPKRLIRPKLARALWSLPVFSRFDGHAGIFSTLNLCFRSAATHCHADDPCVGDHVCAVRAHFYVRGLCGRVWARVPPGRCVWRAICSLGPWRMCRIKAALLAQVHSSRRTPLVPKHWTTERLMAGTSLLALLVQKYKY